MEQKQNCFVKLEYQNLCLNVYIPFYPCHPLGERHITKHHHHRYHSDHACCCYSFCHILGILDFAIERNVTNSK